MASCDSCTACCKVMKIAELDKPAHVWCKDCDIGRGCRSYDTRPESCRVYECLWLQTQRGGKPLALALRPDKSKVVIGVTNGGEDIVLYVPPERPEAWRQGEFGKFVDDLRGRRVTVLISCGERLQRL